jgi:hypothetical protein
MEARIFIQMSDITTPGMVRLSFRVRCVSGRDPVANNAAHAAASCSNLAWQACLQQSGAHQA